MSGPTLCGSLVVKNRHARQGVVKCGTLQRLRDAKSVVVQANNGVRGPARHNSRCCPRRVAQGRGSLFGGLELTIPVGSQLAWCILTNSRAVPQCIEYQGPCPWRSYFCLQGPPMTLSPYRRLSLAGVDDTDASICRVLPGLCGQQALAPCPVDCREAAASSGGQKQWRIQASPLVTAIDTTREPQYRTCHAADYLPVIYLTGWQLT
jgi:hypothetical protein